MSSFLIVSILFLSALLSGIAVFFVKRDNTQLLKLVLSFSGAYLFAITVLHLIPEVYHSNQTPGEIIGLYILGGFLFQLILEHVSQGIEHGIFIITKMDIIIKHFLLQFWSAYVCMHF